MRVLAVVFAGAYLLQIGPESLTSADTTGLLIDPASGLVTFMFILFLFAGLLLPLLTDFGLLEFFGSMMVKIMRPLFKILVVLPLTAWHHGSVTGQSVCYLRVNNTRKRTTPHVKPLRLRQLSPLCRLHSA